MSQKEIWSKYILAQERILEHKSIPIGIDDSTKPRIDSNLIHLRVDQDIFKKVFKADIENAFKLKDFDFNQHFILQDLKITEQINLEKLSKLKEAALNNYIEFSEHPVIEGEIVSIQDQHTQLEGIIGNLPTNYSFKKNGLILLTLEEKETCERIDNIIFENKAGAVFQIKPSICYLIASLYSNINISQNEMYVISLDGRLHPKVESDFGKLFSMEIISHQLLFKVEDCPNINETVEQLRKKGISLPSPSDNTFEFSFQYKQRNRKIEEPTVEIRYLDNSEIEFEVGDEVARIRKLLTKHFEQNKISFSFTSQYRYDLRKLNKARESLRVKEDVFWDKLYSEIHGDKFQVSQSSHTISFDFECTDDLKEKIEILKGIWYLDINDWKESHKYKFNIRFNTGLHELQTQLSDELPNLTTKLLANGARLIFRQFYKSGNKGFIRDNLNNRLHELIDTEKFPFTISDTFQEKYLCEENFDLKVEQEEEKLSKLIREEFHFGDRNEKYKLGRLQKIDYPNLEFSIEDEEAEEVKEYIERLGVKAIFPDLKGEKDKIVRLSNALEKLRSKVKLPNENAREFLFDSSKAKEISAIEYLLNPQSQEWKSFEQSIFAKQLNNSQKKAIYKCLHAEELALIQGPPGTGKSTAIAEIVWHHILRKQKERILLTSETNLAVDNAINRLKNNEQNLVKPIRFGSDERLESEGRFYSLAEIENWTKNSSDTDNNAVSHWMQNIQARINPHTDERIRGAQDKWKCYIKKPTIETKVVFSESYIEHANLIGATGSSIGKLNSQGKFTSFFHSYLKVFARQLYHPKIEWESCNREEIWFDTVIMDEASKATPPELALPVLFGKKAVIVGDHRQLPPLVDGNEIEDTLLSIGESKLARTLSRKSFDRSMFQELFENIDDSIKATFNIQYRMHPAINDVISQFYDADGGLECGLPLEEEHHQSFGNPMSRHHGLSYENFITPKTHVIWINVSTPEIQEGTSRVNFGEIDALDNTLNAIKNSSGFSEYLDWLKPQTQEEKQFGIISFYGKQIKHIKRMLREKHDNILSRISTVDRFQGMERNIIIVSMVRSGIIANSKDQKPNIEIYGENGYPDQTSLGFAEFPNRLNVALSRARRLLIIIGNKDHFCKKQIYKNVFNSISSSESGRIIEAETLSNVLSE